MILCLCQSYHSLRVKFMVIIIELRLKLGIKGLKIASKTNLESGPWGEIHPKLEFCYLSLRMKNPAIVELGESQPCNIRLKSKTVVIILAVVNMQKYAVTLSFVVTWWPQGNVCIVALFWAHTIHWNKNKIWFFLQTRVVERAPQWSSGKQTGLQGRKSCEGFFLCVFLASAFFKDFSLC